MSSRRLVLVVLSFAYYMALTASYAIVESQLFDSIGMEYFPPGLNFQLLAAAMAVLPSFWLPTTARLPSHVCVWILYISLVVPLMFIPYHVLTGSARSIAVLPTVVLGLFMVLLIILKLPPLKLPRFRVSPRIVYRSLQLALILSTLIVIYLNGSLHLNLSLEDVYSRRLDARDEVHSGSLVAYGLTTLSYAFAPLALLLGIARRNYFLTGAAVFAFLCIFSYRATKTDLFMPLFLASTFYLLRRRSLSFPVVLTAAALLLAAVSMIEYVTLHTSVLSGYLVRRQLMIPSLLTSYYWDFFSYHPLVYYSDKFYGSCFMPPQYDLPLARLIGYEYLGSGESNANTCFWASAFANLGYPGMCLVTFLLGIILRAIDAIGLEGDEVVTGTMAGLFGLQLTNGALETCMVTGGVAVSMFLLHCMDQPTNAKLTALSLRNSASKRWRPTGLWTN